MLGFHCTRKRPFLIPKQLAFHQRRDERAAIHRHKRSLRHRSAKMNRPRHQLLPCTALSHDQHRRPRVLQPRNHPQHILNFCRCAHDSVEVFFRAHPLAQKLVLGDEPHLLRHALQQQAHLLHAERLLDVVVRSQFHCVHSRLNRSVACHDRHFRARQDGLHLSQKFYARQIRQL